VFDGGARHQAAPDRDVFQTLGVGDQNIAAFAATDRAMQGAVIGHNAFHGAIALMSMNSDSKVNLV